MNNIFSGLFSCVRIKKAYFVCLIFFTIIAVVLGVIAAINFGGGVYAVDLEHISYVKFLKGDCGFMSLIFNLILSLSVFFIVIYLCNFKSWLVPLAILFYLYLVYSQTVIFLSVILIYGILNCIIFVILLLIFDLCVWLIFMLVLLHLSFHINSCGYFKNCLSFKESKVLLLIFMYVLTVAIFALILMILKNYVVLLIY